MNRSVLLLLALICLLLSCKRSDNNKKENVIHDEYNHDYDTTRIVRSNAERLRNHFIHHEIRPKMMINNIDGNENEIKLANHNIKWINGRKETILIIDNKQISLKGTTTINEVHNFKKDTLNFTGKWTQVKLYKLNGRDIIAVEIEYSIYKDYPTNLYLLYDTAKKTTNYFGAFEAKNGMNLYNFGDDKIRFVSQSHLITPTCPEDIYNIYSIDNEGIFQLQKKRNGKPYEILHFYTPEGIKEFEGLVQDDWIKKIK
ncbi:hypothetical protein [Flavobacterium cerinum]|uniref:Uncharacterized protein n=1 Tax=Flavobacterium cerinum TaxID=2502784 RepID=A0A444H8R1_9FLAO|nr:hypothetical protein [Flavobacterium cerinum]RWW99558.1 hypothetical protein EPI11_11435 [Flavobacterium cerinum]